jgi:hypothetical protein
MIAFDTLYLAKVGVEGSNPFARSNKIKHLRKMKGAPEGAFAFQSKAVHAARGRAPGLSGTPTDHSFQA